MTYRSKPHPKRTRNLVSIRKSRDKSKAKRAASNAIWKKANRDKCRAYCLNYLSRLKGAEGTFNETHIQAILEQQSYRCAGPHCRIDLLRSYHVDHIIPLARGGTNWPDNLQILCKDCNQSKHAQLMEDWVVRKANGG